MGEPMSQQEENRFWLQVFGDKARIVHKELFPTETDLVARADAFIPLFDNLLAEAAAGENQVDVNRKAYPIVQDFRHFLLVIIRTQISEKSAIGILPDYLGVYVNESELYLSYLYAAMQGAPFTMNALEVALVWTLNAYLGAVHLEDNLGTAFVDFKTKATDYSHGFLILYLRAQILDGFLRTGLKHFPMLDAFYNDLANHMTKYAEFVVDIIQLTEKRTFVGTLSLLDLDDLYRILCYVMKKLSEVSSIRPPACDPTAPRRE